jgi:hypothetical protein
MKSFGGTALQTEAREKRKPGAGLSVPTTFRPCLCGHAASEHAPDDTGCRREGCGCPWYMEGISCG